jgi:hypothetical protein
MPWNAATEHVCESGALWVPPVKWRDVCGMSRVVGQGRDGGGLVQDAFWGTVSLMILGVLVGLLVLMLVEDVQKAMGERRYAREHLRI